MATINANTLSACEWPVVFDPEWLPSTDWPELEELRTRHVSIFTELKAHREKYEAMARHYREQDETYRTKLGAAFTQKKQPEPPTPKEERDEILGRMVERYKAGLDALAKVANEALELIESHSGHFHEDIRKVEAAAESHQQELRKKLAELDQERVRLTRLDSWVERTAGEQVDFTALQLRLYPFDQWGMPTELEPGTAALVEEEMERRARERSAA